MDYEKIVILIIVRKSIYHSSSIIYFEAYDTLLLIRLDCLSSDDLGLMFFYAFGSLRQRRLSQISRHNTIIPILLWRTCISVCIIRMYVFYGLCRLLSTFVRRKCE